MTWNRPVPLVGDTTSAAERAAEVGAWAFPEDEREALYAVVGARRDIRRYRPDPLDPALVHRVLTAAHQAPSVGHSQPWRFVLVADPATRDRAARMADEQRLRQARQMEPESARRLLDLQLEGIREAPLGVVVTCDRRTPAGGVLGRATFPDADLWSCACAIQNLWLAARAEGLGVGWVTLFDPAELEALVGVPEGVVTLGWLCLGWPDERPPAPGLERAGWSRRQPVEQVVLHERWQEASPAPVSHLRSPRNEAVVGARDRSDELLTTPGSLGLLDRCVDRVEAAGAARSVAVPDGTVGAVGVAAAASTSESAGFAGSAGESAGSASTAEPTGALLLAAGRHLVTRHGVSAFADHVTDDVLAASRAGESAGAVAAAAAGLALEVVDAGTATGDVLATDALTADRVEELVALGRRTGAELGRRHALVALGEVGIGNTTVAAALTSALLGVPAAAVVGLGASADSAMLARKTDVVDRAVARLRADDGLAPGEPVDPLRALAAVGGPESCVLAGAVLGAASVGAVCVLDGLATSVAALVAVRLEPAAAAYLLAGQRSREQGHALVLEHLGLEPLLDLRLRAGEGVGACLASGLLVDGLRVRRGTGRTAPRPVG